jgi:O-antigen/teichoic acid export membrane protein
VSTVRRIARNTLLLFSSNVLGLLLSFFYLIYATRYLGAGNYGILSLGLAFTSIVGFFTDIGLVSVTIRDVARDRSLVEKYAGNIVVLKLLLAILTFILTVLIVHLLEYPETTAAVIYVILLSVIFTAFAGVFIGIFQAFEKMEYVAIGSVLNNFIMLMGALFAISKEANVQGFAYIYLFASIILFIYNLFVSRRMFIRPRLELDLDLCRYLIREALPFGLSAFFIRIYYYIDIFMISLIIVNPNEIMGWYNAAYRLVFVLSFIPTTFLMAMYPIMSKCHISADESLGFMFERSFKYMLIIAVPIGVGTTLLAEKIIYATYGPAFAPSSIALQILIWSEVLIFLNSVFGNLLNSTNRQAVVAKQTILASILNILLNLVLIPSNSYVGASIATVITTSFAFIFLLTSTSKSGYRLPNKIIIDLLKVLFASFIMFIFIEIIIDTNLALLILSAACIYFIIILILKTMDDIDIQLFKKLIGRTDHPVKAR